SCLRTSCLACSRSGSMNLVKSPLNSSTAFRRDGLATKRSRAIAEYIDSAPPQAQEYLRKLYALLKQVAPDAKEAIKWGNPVFEAHRILFAFSAHKAHINFAPTPAALKPFRDELAKHKTGKGTLQIPYDK